MLYDIVDESDRTDRDRPFPYLPTIDPADFLATHLGARERSVIVYRCVGKYTQPQLESWLRDRDPERVSTVFVGAASRDMPVETTLTRARELRSPGEAGGAPGRRRDPRAPLRRSRGARPAARQGGARLFLLHHAGRLRRTGGPATRSPTTTTRAVTAGPSRRRSSSRSRSADHSRRWSSCAGWESTSRGGWRTRSATATTPSRRPRNTAPATAGDPAGFCRSLGVPFGFSVESVSIRKAEIDAAVALAGRLRAEVL
ncbi:hypothetical protein [Nocardioides sp. B-3]|uniref:hypothetical protein n=1 Tax=Nocardioides sp. B-3 TaxID=2895565 RepID=UPI0021533EB6|nr:hypothetical protein [Nocardioides sp. B-3]UUZ57930.1 hypothetical protein LP418_16425 [Nocardioides sp. B-3]